MKTQLIIMDSFGTTYDSDDSIIFSKKELKELYFKDYDRIKFKTINNITIVYGENDKIRQWTYNSIASEIIESEIFSHIILFWHQQKDNQTEITYEDFNDSVDRIISSAINSIIILNTQNKNEDSNEDESSSVSEFLSSKVMIFENNIIDLNEDEMKEFTKTHMDLKFDNYLTCKNNNKEIVFLEKQGAIMYIEDGTGYLLYKQTNVNSLGEIKQEILN